MLAIEQLHTRRDEEFKLGNHDAAREFARIVRSNEALDVVNVRRVGCTVRVTHEGFEFDRAYLLGLSHGLGADR